MEKKLDGLRFRLDERTGAIIADNHVTEGAMADDAMLVLLREDGLGMMDIQPLAVESSSQLAFQVVPAELLPWQRSWAPPGILPLQQHSNTEYEP